MYNAVQLIKNTAQNIIEDVNEDDECITFILNSKN